jgi:glycosyltransferase involved in cell wall biosynthesis
VKLIIQIPCLNEADSLPKTLSALPRVVDGFGQVEWLVIDDGSTDDTAGVARRCGVDHVVTHTKNRGLARAFMSGLARCLELGADVIVNTDADNQYCADDIGKLVEPILAKRADIVVGARPIREIGHFSLTKKVLQRIGSSVVRLASNTDVADAPSGFRAISRDAALHLNVFNEYTYTLETIIQAGQRHMLVESVPVRTNEFVRPSRLFKSIPQYLRRSMLTIARIFVVYKPFASFVSVGLVLLAAGVLIGLRYLYYMFVGDAGGHVQSLILASILIGMGFQTILIGFVADLLAVNRRLLEDIRVEQRRLVLEERSKERSDEIRIRSMPSGRIASGAD